MKLLTTVQWIFEADAIQMLLETEGIHAEILDWAAITLAPYLSNAFGGIRIIVNDEDYDAACEILKQRGDATAWVPTEGIFICPKCQSNHVIYERAFIPVNIWHLSMYFLFDKQKLEPSHRRFTCKQCHHRWSEKVDIDKA